MIRFTKPIERKTIGRGAALAVLAAVLLGTSAPAFGQITTTLAVEPHWKLQVKPDAAAIVAGRLPYEDYIMVEDVSVTSFELNRLGFGSFTPSISLGAGGAIIFSVSLKSNLQGTVDISGTMVAGSLSGSAKWTKPDGKVYNYTFTGVPYTPAVDPES